ncbi:MAG: hypothetical protein WBP79_09025 [Candidatus Acidiferrales bacterium]
MQKLLFLLILVAALLAGAAPAAHAQDTKGPMAPPPKFEVHRVSNEPHPPAPPIPEAEIIKRFAANEQVMKKKYDEYNFTQTIRVEELSDPGGKFTATGDVYTKPDGQRFMRVTKPPESDLKLTNFSLEDVRTIASLPLFVLTLEELTNYDFKYAGQDQLDQLNTYVFQVKPKSLSRTKRFFEGAIWVDDRDFVIVKSYGKFVSEIAGNGSKLPFTMFETYRENFQDKYWLPTYTKSEDTMAGPKDTELRMRLVIRATNFKLNNPPATPAQPPSSTPTKPGPPS